MKTARGGTEGDVMWRADGWDVRWRLGVVAPHADVGPESELRAAAPSEVGIYAARARFGAMAAGGKMDATIPLAPVRAFAEPPGVDDAVGLLADAPVQAIGFGKLGYEHLRRHDLRHTGLTWMADAGVPVHVLRKIAGHGSLTTTQRYLHPDAGTIAAAGDSLTAYLSAPRSPNGPQLRVVRGTA